MSVSQYGYGPPTTAAMGGLQIGFWIVLALLVIAGVFCCLRDDGMGD